MKPNLRDRAIDVLKKHVGQRRQISRDTGLGYEWINKMVRGEIKEPGASKVEKLISWSEKNA